LLDLLDLLYLVVGGCSGDGEGVELEWFWFMGKCKLLIIDMIMIEVIGRWWWFSKKVWHSIIFHTFIFIFSSILAFKCIINK
jgi:hypothetical protein